MKHITISLTQIVVSGLFRIGRLIGLTLERPTVSSSSEQYFVDNPYFFSS